MARETLAVKYRPKTFEEVSEQKGIITILKNQLKTGDVKNAYLFTGSAGTGKTTCARILANEINHGEGIPEEKDAASNNSVEHIRKIVDDARYKSVHSLYKVFIIDECHTLSNAAWQAFLKCLEEPPQKTIFIFCTTDPQKIPNTILSRVQRFDFQRITPNGILQRLEQICKAEKIKYDNDALEYISRFVSGGMRDGISLMDKCLAYAEKLTFEGVLEVVGSVNFTEVFNLLSCIEAKDKKSAEEAINILHDVYNAGKDLKQFCLGFVKVLMDLAKYQLTGDYAVCRYVPKSFIEKFLKTTKLTRYDFLDLIDGLNELNYRIKWDNSPFALIEFWFMQNTMAKGK